jgi:hypothetical protein
MTDCAAQALRVWQKLRIELAPFAAQKRSAALISDCDVLPELNFSNVRGLRQDAQKALLWFAMGKYPGEVHDDEAPVCEVVRLQSLGTRPIGLGGSKAQFALHDLCHLAKFRGDLGHVADWHCYVGQVGFFHFLWHTWDTWAMWAQNPDFAYALADMNGNPQFLWKSLFSRWTAAAKIEASSSWLEFRRLVAIPLPNRPWATPDDWAFLAEFAQKIGLSALKSAGRLQQEILPPQIRLPSVTLTY